jgi:hypothetical protein
MVMAVNIVRRAINVWRIGPEGNAELIVTYGEELLASSQAVNLLWHSAGHYGEDALVILHVPNKWMYSKYLNEFILLMEKEASSRHEET